MHNVTQFETPENVQLSYELAGPGTRFVAWFMDTILMCLIGVAFFFVMLIVGASFDIIRRNFSNNSGHPFFYFLAVYYIAYSFGSLLYFGLSELLLRGQTIGKRSVHIRVVKADGFALDPLAIFLRTVFRLVDNIPAMFAVPIFTAKCQRLGDLVAGTIVVADLKTDLGSLRTDLTSQKVLDSKFQFDAAMLNRARPQDFAAVEKLLERWTLLDEEGQQNIANRIVVPLSARLQVECPPPSDRYYFLRDLLAAEYRRQHRKLG